jgi:transposase, IS30 family
MATIIYHHLTYEDRCQIFALLKNSMSKNMIAKQLRVNRSTISRELRRNKGNDVYTYGHAQSLSIERRKEASSIPLKMKGNVLEIVKQKLQDEQWSPVQISGWMKVNLNTSVSHEEIYQYVWKDKKEGGLLYKNLRHNGKKYNKRKGKNAGRGLIPNRVDIDKRPSIVEEKTRVGDWEIDTIIGKDHVGAIVSMVDRTTKYTKLVLVENKTSEAVTKGIQDALEPLSDVVLTLTADNGKEFAMHEKISTLLDAQVYFATPYHSWERGLNEHTNGLVRQYLPKKTRFDILTKEEVQRIENLLNTRPRKVLKFLTPLEAFKRARFCPSLVALQS